jgi:hypothetical protein
MPVRARTPIDLNRCFSGSPLVRVVGMRRRLGIGAIAAAMVLAAAQPSTAAVGWLPSVSPFGDTESGNVNATMTPDGTVAIARTTDDNTLEVRIRPPGGDFGPATPVARGALGPIGLVAGRDGSIAAFWRDGLNPLNMAAVRPPGGTFSAPLELDHESAPAPDQLAVDSHQRVWLANEYFGSGTVTTAAPGGTGRSFPLGPDAGGPWFTDWVSLGIDASGHVTVVYTRTSATTGAADGDPCYVDGEIRAAEGDASGIADVAVLATTRLTGTTNAGNCEHQNGTYPSAAKVAVRPNGEAVATYGAINVVDDTDTALQPLARVRPAGGAWPSSASPAEPIASASVETDITPAFAGATPIAVLWDFASLDVRLSSRTAGSIWSTPQTVAPAGGSAALVAGSPSGTAMIAFDAVDSGRVSAVVRAADGTLAPPAPLSDPAAALGGVAMDDEGNGVAAWTQYVGLQDRAALAGYDGAPPRLSASFPAGGSVGQALPFSATALDVWSGATIGWSFGDGTSASGASVSHAYGSASAFPASVTAVDALGNASTRSATIPVRAVSDTTRPTFRGRPSVHPRRVRRGRRATIDFDLSEAATVRATLLDSRRGVRRGHRCVAPRRHAGRHGRRCVRITQVAQRSTHVDAAGTGTIVLGTRRLRPGGYTIVLQATDAAGNRSTAVRLHLTVLPRARR